MLLEVESLSARMWQRVRNLSKIIITPSPGGGSQGDPTMVLALGFGCGVALVWMLWYLQIFVR